MKNLNKTGLALGVALAVASTGAFAGTFQTAGSESVGVEASTAGNLTADIGVADVAAITLTPNSASSQDNRLFITLSNGATFADSTYVLAVSGTESDLSSSQTDNDLTAFTLITPTTAGATSLEFRVASDISPNDEFVLSGSSVASQPVTLNVPAMAAGSSIEIDANADDSFGTFDFYTAVEVLEAANQFSAVVGDTVANGIVDVNDDRLSFEDGSVDTVGLAFTQATLDNGVAINANDTVDIVLSGDMSGIGSVALLTGGASTDQGDFTVDESAGTATFTAEGSDLFSAGVTTSGVLSITVTGSSSLATRSFTVQADADFETETDKNLIAAATAAGSWTINGLQAKVAHLSLNVSGFISWLKVVNEGTAAAEITSDIIWTLADGTEGSVRNADLGSVDAGGVFTVSEAAILTAIGSPTQVVDLSMTVTVAGQTNLVHLTAEKKASDGRTTLPVYYNTDAGRDWVQ